MRQHLQQNRSPLETDSRMVFGPFAGNLTNTAKFINCDGRRLEFASEITDRDGRLRFEENMSVLGCCYVATLIGLTFGLSVEPIDAKKDRLAFRYRNKQLGYVAPEAFILDRPAEHLVIRLPRKDIVTRASHAPIGNLEAIAGILAALHGLARHETDRDKITWRKKSADQK